MTYIQTSKDTLVDYFFFWGNGNRDLDIELFLKTFAKNVSEDVTLLLQNIPEQRFPDCKQGVKLVAESNLIRLTPGDSKKEVIKAAKELAKEINSKYAVFSLYVCVVIFATVKSDDPFDPVMDVVDPDTFEISSVPGKLKKAMKIRYATLGE
jgi:hypothetical protein